MEFYYSGYIVILLLVIAAICAFNGWYNAESKTERNYWYVAAGVVAVVALIWIVFFGIGGDYWYDEPVVVSSRRGRPASSKRVSASRRS